ncbi:MAG: nicotinate (nicotinamide) nucleotide adenylyltransferase [Chitinophagales bacterium]|nr:nicotinate (nicotinamide) nucleotide adenylyltransferase [Chitinophagales bacterium]MDW8393257.1 nicotinate (nicotinamide) nucleotide adenylyltransferase [Chitinophagales bacterium]
MTGLFFGSFNPIHIGHLIVAEFLCDEAGLSAVWFVVSPQNPFKKPAQLADVRHRLRMVQLAVAGNRRFHVSDIELHLPTPSYSVRTLQVLKERYPRRSFALLMGSDTLHSLPRWKNGKELMRNYPVLVYRRSSSKQQEMMPLPNIRFFDAPTLPVSASGIRSRLRRGQSVRYLVPEAVRRYMLRHKLYSP